MFSVVIFHYCNDLFYCCLLPYGESVNEVVYFAISVSVTVTVD